MTFYFAWVGGDPLPPLTLNTTGDVWGGSFTLLGSTWNGELHATGDIFTTGFFVQKGPRIENLDRVDGLVIGQTYQILGPEFTTPGELPISGTGSPRGGTSFTYEGDFAGSLRPPAVIGEGVSVIIKTPVGLNVVHMNPNQPDFSLLVVGRTYRISGSGIPDNTFFTFNGTPILTMTNNARSSGINVDLTISFSIGTNIISNLADTTGLIAGQDYRVFGKGISPSTIGRFLDDGTIFLSQPATETTRQTYLTIHRGQVFTDGGSFNESEHARFDEQVLAVRIEHSEGNSPTLSIELKNPRVGFLAPGRQVWCWLSWREADSSDIIPLFHGRLVAVPADLQAERITLQFLARPYDYDNQQAIGAVDLRAEEPFYDRVWLTNGIDDPNTLLEARTSLWHIDRVTQEVTVSDIIVGEDGTLEIGESDHFYPAFNVKYGSPPLSGVYLSGTVSWDQEDTKEIDITSHLVNAFRNGGSPFGYPNIAVHCGDGIFSSWPKPGSGIGGGWQVGASSRIIRPIAFYKLGTQNQFVSKYATGEFPTLGIGTADSMSALNNTWQAFNLFFPVDVFNVTFSVTYSAKRSRKETVSFFLEADVQEIVTDNLSNVETFSLNSTIITEPIDPDGRTPLRDRRSNTYFKTARGQQSFRFLLAYARAKLIWRARAITIDFATEWKTALPLSCRWNVHITDRRLPGGEARGKVVAYKLESTPSAGLRANVSIGCTIGRGGSVAAVDGVPEYVDPGYVDSGYQATAGGWDDFGDGTIIYQNFDDFRVLDDSVDLFNMTPRNIIKRLKIIGSYNDQLRAIGMMKGIQTNPIVQAESNLTNAHPSLPPDPASALKNMYPRVLLELRSVTGGGFSSTFPVRTSTLQVPKTIDLEAP